ncbi:Hypothetical predicted protein [Octopus vulgaris]|uniref:Uncharacterized protein n=1 Tax=Octopus vulgaris TaxID=6645 RepID=A0AA36B396_OCTVU|nr:Hypothetical predicted protein [Octopus vulgaris]
MFRRKAKFSIIIILSRLTGLSGDNSEECLIFSSGMTSRSATIRMLNLPFYFGFKLTALLIAGNFIIIRLVSPEKPTDTF